MWRWRRIMIMSLNNKLNETKIEIDLIPFHCFGSSIALVWLLAFAPLSSFVPPFTLQYLMNFDYIQNILVNSSINNLFPNARCFFPISVCFILFFFSIFQNRHSKCSRILHQYAYRHTLFPKRCEWCGGGRTKSSKIRFK